MPCVPLFRVVLTLDYNGPQIVLAQFAEQARAYEFIGLILMNGTEIRVDDLSIVCKE